MLLELPMASECFRPLFIPITTCDVVKRPGVGRIPEAKSSFIRPCSAARRVLGSWPANSLGPTIPRDVGAHTRHCPRVGPWTCHQPLSQHISTVRTMPGRVYDISARLGAQGSC